MRTTALRSLLPGWLGLLARLALAAVWLYAGASKAADLPGSIRAVNAYELLPIAAGQVVGAALPFAEIALGLVLLAGLGVRVSAVVSALLLAGFVIGIASAWARGLQIDCGCFGGGGALAAGETPRYGAEIARDLALFAASAALAIWPRSPLSVDSALSTDAGKAEDAALTGEPEDSAPPPPAPQHTEAARHDQLGDR